MIGSFSTFSVFKPKKVSNQHYFFLHKKPNKVLVLNHTISFLIKFSSHLDAFSDYR